MPLEMFTLQCPRCGRVEGYPETEAADADVLVDEEALITQQEFTSPGGPVTKCRCPQCGTWVDADAVEPT
ncbi:MAG: hypothetical protein ACOC95_01570 [Planctomycetota bacterium]